MVVLPAGVGREAFGAEGFMFSVCGRDEEDALAAPLRGAAFGGMVLWCDVVDGVVVPVFGGLKKKL